MSNDSVAKRNSNAIAVVMRRALASIGPAPAPVGGEALKALLGGQRLHVGTGRVPRLPGAVSARAGAQARHEARFVTLASPRLDLVEVRAQRVDLRLHVV